MYKMNIQSQAHIWLYIEGVPIKMSVGVISDTNVPKKKLFV